MTEIDKCAEWSRKGSR